MSAIVFDIALILLLIIANGVFSGSEIAVVSARKVRLEQMSRQGNVKARLALKLANSPNNFLSTVQIGITLIGILSGAIGGATVAQRLEEVLALVPIFQPYHETLSLVIVVGLITYLSLVVGELLPKRVALNHPEQVACAIAQPMRLLSRITAPVVYLLGASTDFLLKLLRIRASEESPVTEEEIKALIRQGTQAGMFEEAEQEMVSRVFRLGDRSIKSVMTPRIDIDWIDTNAPIEDTQQLIKDSSYSRFPVGQGSLDNCLGVVRVRDFLSAYMAGQAIDLQGMLQTPLFVSENTPALKVLETFQESGTHIALLTDEYGGIEGLVTLNDLVEAIVGELPSAEDLDEPMVVRRENGSWFIDGALSIDELRNLLNQEFSARAEISSQEFLAGGEVGNYHTLAGFVITALGRIPTSGDYFTWGNLQFEVVDMDGNRVDKVLVTRNQTDAENHRNVNTQESD
ncbi:MAG: hemolysin family protein [Drouetiella hepatica Uher 2000/2452]|jgi:putative hemolysin|uniref:Hemolysin family protein n=1 Tax=Drouetiella hepatica Uher 2000/2452 TaxID=904376 RepID=A0A951QH54_9CYAN|nr:hemolysin family protein [Drouetiella hepatica Uher 2000/2452]